MRPPRILLALTLILGLFISCSLEPQKVQLNIVILENGERIKSGLILLGREGRDPESKFLNEKGSAVFLVDQEEKVFLVFVVRNGILVHRTDVDLNNFEGRKKQIDVFIDIGREFKEHY